MCHGIVHPRNHFSSLPSAIYFCSMLLLCAANLTRTISANKPNLVIQAGIAGSLDPELEPGTVVIVKRESIGDLGVIEKGLFTSMFHLGFIKKDEHPFSNGKLCAPDFLLKKTGLPITDGVSINEITTNKERIRFYQNELNASVESMEGAALHYVCLMEAVPFLQLRSVSNFVGERDKSRWKIKEAVMQLNTELQKLLIKLLNT
jgi:futalosine hydrolase